MRIALASCDILEGWEVDDRALHLALGARGCSLSHPSWDDPAVCWEDFDAVLIRTTWNYTAHLDAFLAWSEAVAAQVPMFNGPRVLRWNTHKGYLAELQSWGLPVVPTAYVGPGERADLAGILAERGWTRGFLKPVVGASAEGTRRLEGPPGAEDQAWLEALVAKGGAMVQPYRDSVEELGELSVLVVEGRAAHGVRKVPRGGDYRVQDDHGALDMALELSPELVALAEGAVARVSQELGESLLYGRVDLLMGPEGPELCELELVEPSLFLRRGPATADRLAEALLARLGAAIGRRQPASRPRYLAVVFDLDGTVLDSSAVVVETVQAARASLGLAPVAPAEVVARIGLPLGQMVAELCAPGEDHAGVTQAYRERYGDLAAAHERVFAGMLELLVDLRCAGARVGVATGKSQYGAEHATGRHRLGHWVEAVHGILPGTPGKPHPAVLERAMRELGAGPGDTIFVGDTTFDMEVARGAGAVGWGVAWGSHSEEALRGAGATGVAVDVAALRAALLE